MLVVAIITVVFFIFPR